MNQVQETIFPAVYEALSTAYAEGDMGTVGIIHRMLDVYHRSTGESDSGLGFDLFLVAGLLLDTPSMGEQHLADLPDLYPDLSKRG